MSPDPAAPPPHRSVHSWYLTRAFLFDLASRRIELPTGTPDDPPGAPTVHGLSNRKNALVLQVLTSAGLSELFNARVDGVVAAREGLAGADLVVSDPAELLDRP